MAVTREYAGSSTNMVRPCSLTTTLFIWQQGLIHQLIEVNKTMNSTKFLETRDPNFDFCRSFLVFTMLIAHPLQWYYIVDYNKNIDWYAPSGFVFLAGFTSSLLYSRKQARDPGYVKTKLIGRFFRFMGLFLALNAAGILFQPARLTKILSAFAPWEIPVKLIFLLDKRYLLSYEILVPIALTSLLSWFLIRLLNRGGAMVAFIACFSFLCFIESTGFFNYYGTRTTCIGVLGSLAGIYLSNARWDTIRARLSGPYTLLFLAIPLFLYYYAVFMFTARGNPVYFWIHFFPMVWILSTVYTLSFRLRLPKRPVFKQLNTIFSNHMLFIYVFHLSLLFFLSHVIPTHRLTLLPMLGTIAFVMLASILLCSFIDYCTQKSLVLRSAYASIFR